MADNTPVQGSIAVQFRGSSDGRTGAIQVEYQQTETSKGETAKSNLQVEYQEVGEGYRKGFDLIFNASQLFLLLQGGLATALGLTIGNSAIKKIFYFHAA